MDKAIFGDNQFFGVNHMSLEKAIAQEQRYSSPDSIFRTLNEALEIGINTFMCTTHDRLEPVFDRMKNDSRFSDYKIIPCIPYAHKYANAVTELGFIGGLQKYMPGNFLSTGLRGAKALISTDYIEIMRMLVDSEIKGLSGMNVEAIFIQNAVTDLLLGLGMKDFFVEYYKYIKSKYKAEVGFITMNYCALTKVLTEELGISDVYICTPVNKIGFRMIPSKEEVENMIRDKGMKTIAMSVLASGAVSPEEAIEYVKSINGITSVLFGASSREHIKHTYDLIMM